MEGVVSMIPNVENVFKNHHITNLTFLSVYNPYINYSWSQTLTVGDTQQIKDIGTAGLNLQQLFGQGCWFNGVDNNISIGSVPVSNNMSLTYNFVPTPNSRIFGRNTWDTFIGFSTISATEGVVRCRFTGTDMVFTYNLKIGIPYSIVLVLKPNVIDLWVNGVLRESIPHTFTFAHPLEFIGKNATTFANCVIKDVFIFNKHLTQSEIVKYTNNPNQFFMDSLEDSSCVLSMPMCEKNNLIRNYKNNTDYPIINYLATCRTNAQRLPYGLQTSGFKRDSLGRILSKSNFLEADGVGYGNTGWIPDISKPTTIECILDKKGIDDLQMNGADYLRIGVAINNTLYFRCGDKQPLVAGTAVDSVYYMVVAFDGSIVTFYVNGIKNQTTSYVATLDSTTFKFFTSSLNKPSKSPIRLFKVHQKALTQGEVTQNFNKYQAQGLLNE